jgi:hypothetical protein
MFGSKRKPERESPDVPLAPTPIPPLVQLLSLMERKKGAPLTEEEVLEIRDKAVCMMLPPWAVQKMAESRGYLDIDPDFVWEQWQEVRRDSGSDNTA